MSKFVNFFARGVIYKRDENGCVCGVKNRYYGEGVTLNNAGLMGKVFAQCPNLLRCDRVEVSTVQIL